MYLSKAILVLGLGLAFVSCSKQEPEVSLANPSGQTQTSISGPTERIQFAASVGLDDDLRALEGTKFYRGRLRPQITGGMVSVRVYLGSKTQTTLTPLTLDFKYDEDSNSISYRGEITVPEGLITASDLKMLMLVANDGQITDNDTKLDVQQTIKTPFYDNGSFADGTKLADMKVPYSTGWLNVAGLAEGDKLDVARTTVKLKPLGHVVKLEVDVTQSALEEVTFKGFRVESTAITDRGSYALPQDHNQIGDEGANLIFTPVLGSQNQKIGTFELQATEEVIAKTSPKSKTVFVWVEQIPSSSLKAPYSTRQNRWTRGFVEFKKSKPVLDERFTAGSGWTGLNGTIVPAYYTASDFSKKGSTMSMQLDNPKVVSSIDRIPHSYMATTFGTGNNATIRDNEVGLGIYADREKRYYSHFSYPWLEQQNYVGDTRVPIIIPNSPEENSKTVKFRIPTLEELACIMPTASVGEALRLRWHNGQPIDIASERVKLGGVGSSPASYSATYQTYRRIPGSASAFTGALAVRFKGEGDRHKTLFQYRLLDPGGNGDGARVQVQTFYLGSFYPEINTPRDFENFLRDYPDATAMLPHKPMSERILKPDSPRAGAFKIRYWVASPAPDPTQATYVEYNFNTAGESVMVKYQDKTDESTKHTVILIRDF